MSRACETTLPCHGAATAIGRAAAYIGARWRTLRRRRLHKRAVASLQALDNRMLKDLGIERSEIESVVTGSNSDTTRLPRT